MKRVAFAWVTLMYDFTTEEEVNKFITDNQRKGWLFGEVYENRNDDLPYTVEVKKPYGNYYPGW